MQLDTLKCIFILNFKIHVYVYLESFRIIGKNVISIIWNMNFRYYIWSLYFSFWVSFKLIFLLLESIHEFRVRNRAMVFNATFNNSSVISWRSILLVEENRSTRRNSHLPSLSLKCITMLEKTEGAIKNGQSRDIR
jgi:hypothetical protein